MKHCGPFPAIVFAVLATSPAGAQTITSIEFTTVPASRGQAFVEYLPGRVVRGGHLSGDAVPFVHQAESTVSRDAAVALWRAARALGDSLLARQDTVPTGGRGYHRLEIERRGRPVTAIVWPEGREHPDPRVRELVRLILAHRVGGW